RTGPPRFPYTTLFRSLGRNVENPRGCGACAAPWLRAGPVARRRRPASGLDGARPVAPPAAAPLAPSLTPAPAERGTWRGRERRRSEEHTSELQSRGHL